MSKLKKLFLVAIIFIIIGGVGCLFTFKSLVREKVDITKEFSADGITNLELDMINEEISIIPTGNSDIVLELKGKSNEPDKKFLDIGQKENTLKVRKKSEKFKFRFFNQGDSLVLTVHLPQKAYETIQADTKNGTIHGEKFTVKSLQASGANGEIVLDEVITDTTEVSTQNGGMELNGVEGSIKAETSNGSIFLEAKTLNQSMDLDAENGSIDINVDEEPTNVTYDLRTGNGGVEVFGNDNWNAVVGDGEHVIKARTANGGITIAK
ncbi:DUF4097 family beta strand repeat-containing protein [Virgibacillus dokdonensis]|uniref:DUF4097 domain-containing protein n=1 Tax=Virgibacillus dokdonensis TaxID=302167 RepID=A0A2K9J4J2_9BACI|nr:DUF4097 family beta strand repeat-containing protein [Virgibacillus dokdonensis]AUJ23920.1 hypothetical protein A21D_00808 [Virgibacillus dokdonensis]